MEMGPVQGLRQGSVLPVQKPDGAQPVVFTIEPTAQTGDESDAANHQMPGRGLEDDSAGPDSDAEGTADGPPEAVGSSQRVNIFA